MKLGDKVWVDYSKSDWHKVTGTLIGWAKLGHVVILDKSREDVKPISDDVEWYISEDKTTVINDILKKELIKRFPKKLCYLVSDSVKLLEGRNRISLNFKLPKI